MVVKAFGMRLIEAEREGRIIMLYHTIAMAIVAKAEILSRCSRSSLTSFSERFSF